MVALVRFSLHIRSKFLVFATLCSIAAGGLYNPACAADKLPWFGRNEALYEQENKLEARTSVSLGQNIYTPEDISETEPIKDDRPYAGWLYLGFGIAANQGSNRFDQLELNVGVVGPSSLAEDVQTTWHDWFGLAEPEGWDNQLDDELGVVLFYEQTRRLETKKWAFGLEWDFMHHFGGALGNVYTFGKAGFTCRLSPDLAVDFGPPRIRPSLPGSGFYARDDGFNWYLFAGVEARLVARNIFLDGSTFEDSQSVDKKPVTGDAQAGIVLQYEDWRFSYTQIWRAKEFDGQERGGTGSAPSEYRTSFSGDDGTIAVPRVSVVASLKRDRRRLDQESFDFPVGDGLFDKVDGLPVVDVVKVGQLFPEQFFVEVRAENFLGPARDFIEPERIFQEKIKIHVILPFGAASQRMGFHGREIRQRRDGYGFFEFPPARNGMGILEKRQFYVVYQNMKLIVRFVQDFIDLDALFVEYLLDPFSLDVFFREQIEIDGTTMPEI